MHPVHCCWGSYRKDHELPRPFMRLAPGQKVADCGPDAGGPRQVDRVPGARLQAEPSTRRQVFGQVAAKRHVDGQIRIPWMTRDGHVSRGSSGVRSSRPINACNGNTRLVSGSSAHFCTQGAGSISGPSRTSAWRYRQRDEAMGRQNHHNCSRINRSCRVRQRSRRPGRSIPTSGCSPITSIGASHRIG